MKEKHNFARNKKDIRNGSSTVNHQILIGYRLHSNWASFDYQHIIKAISCM